MRSVLLIVVFFTCLKLNAQTYISISSNQGGTEETCGDTLTDSNLSGNYSPNENVTITLCPDPAEGSKSYLEFVGEIKLGAGDVLNVYDGENAGASLIFTASGDDPILSDTAINASFSTNLSGCLTAVFISDGAIEDEGWKAGIGCTKPCQTITPDITQTVPASTVNNDDGYINICQGETVTFQAEGDYPQSFLGSPWYSQSDATSNFVWVLSNGDTLSGINLTEIEYTFDYPVSYGYELNLYIEDKEGCVSSGTARRKIRVSNNPLFGVIDVVDDTICFGESTVVNGSVEGIQSNFILGQIKSLDAQIPDDENTKLEEVITISNFAPSDVVQNINDVDLICLEMEHSNVADLEISVECPNGSKIMLLSNPNNSTDVFMGEPVDDDLVPAIQGESYSYCFSVFPQFGLLKDESDAYQYSYTDNNNNLVSDNHFLPSGTYAAETSFSNFINCPLNGDWKLVVQDLNSGDNGYIKSWSLNFNQNLAASPEVYTNTYNTATYAWSDDVVSVTGASATIKPNDRTFENIYNFSVTDNYGCIYDTIFSIYTNIIDVNIYGETNVCDGNLHPLSVYENGDRCIYNLEMFDSFGDGWDGSKVNVIVNGVLSSVYSVQDAGVQNQQVSVTESFVVNDGDFLQIYYEDNTINDDQVSFVLYDSEGTEVLNITSPTQTDTIYGANVNCINDNLSYEWLPNSDINDNTGHSVFVTPSSDVTYKAIIEDGNLGCKDTAEIDLVIVPNFNFTVTPDDVKLCSGETTNFTLQTEPGTYTYSWFPENLFIGNENSVTPLFIPGIYEVIASVRSDLGCTNYDTLILMMSPNAPPVSSIVASPGTLCLFDADSSLLSAQVKDTTSRDCNYYLDMYDSYEEFGWDGGYLETTKNGDRIGNYSALTSNTLVEIPVENGDVLSFNYFEGTWESENTYFIYDSEGNKLFEDGPYPALGEVFSVEVSCPAISIETFYEYNWQEVSTLEGDTAETAMVKPSVDTEYYVTITDGLGGCSDVGSIVVNVTSETFDASITTDDEYCTSQAIDTLKVATPVGAWSGNGIVDNTIGLFDASIAGEGTHWVYYTIPGGCGTIDSAEVEVFLAGAITITTPQDICESGTTDTLLAIPGGGIWTGAGIMNQDLGVFDPQEVTPGTVDITYTLAVCGVSETTTLFVNPTKDVEFTSPFEICDGGLADTIYFAEYDTGGVWTGVGLIEGLEGAFNPDSGVLGFNIIKYEFLDGCKNSFTDTIFIGNRKYATIDSVGVLCENGMSIQLSAANPSGVWTGNGIDDFGLFNPSLSVVGSNEIIYTIDGYCGDEDTLEVIVVNKPEMDFDIIEESCQLANDAGLESFVLGGSEPYTYLWSNGNTVQNIYDLESGSYTLTITDAIGCVNVKSASIEPSEEKCDEPFLFVGNIFSPNGDNANDILIPIGKNIEKVSFVIYNRWGEKVFETQEIGEGWDGHYKGEVAASGVYVYHLKGELNNGQIHEQSGNVTLVR